MRKSFFMFLSFMLSTVVLNAQVMDLNEVDWEVYGILHEQPLITSADQLLSPYSDEAEGLHIEYLIDGDISTFWHSDWHGRVSGMPYFEVVMPEPIEGFVAFTYGRRNNSGTNQTTRFELQVSADNSTWTSAGMCDVDYKAQGEYVFSTPFYIPQGTTRVRVYCVNRTSTVGKKNDIGTGNVHLAEFQLYAVDGNFGKEYALNQFLSKYDAYLAGETVLNMGNSIGQYSDFEAEEAFLGGLGEVSDLLAGGGFASMSNAQVVALVERVEQSLADVYASEVLYTLPADGYYRLVCAKEYTEEVDNGKIDLEGNPVLDQEVVTKALYNNLENKVCWGTINRSDARYLWKLEQAGADIRMCNAGTGEYTDRWEDRRVITDAGAGALMAFDSAEESNGKMLVSIRFASDARNSTASIYFHQVDHKQGLGTGSEVSNWRSTWQLDGGDHGTSEYWLEPVDEAEAEAIISAFELVKNHDKMVMAYTDYINRAATALALAKQDATMPNMQQNLATEASQFSSLWSDPSEGTSFTPFVDGSPTTFWHSDWHSQSQSAIAHSFEITLPEAYAGTLMAIMQRRNTNNNQFTNFTVYATNDAALLDAPGSEGWTMVAEDLYVPWVNGQYTVKTPNITLPEPFKHLRFYVTKIARTDANVYRHFHIAGVKLYPVFNAGHSQFEYYAGDGARLEAIVKAFDPDNTAALTLEQYNALVEAYEAFAPNITSTDVIENAIINNYDAAKNVMVGTQPGFWPSMAAPDALQQTINDAIAYITAAKYTAAENEAWAQRINEAAANINKSTIQIDPTKWYRIRFGTREEYEERGWSMSKARSENASLLGKVLAPGQWADATDNEPGTVHILPHEDIRMGANIHYVDPDELTNDDYCIWRFVPVAEGQWAIQHKYTGLYMLRDRYQNNATRLNAMPTKFEFKPLGKGQVAFVLEDLAGFTWERNYLNGWRDHCMLQAYKPETMGSNSGFFIEEAGEIHDEDIDPFFYFDTKPGDIHAMCLPMPVQINNGIMYTVAGTYEENDAQFIALNIIEEAAPGEPFIYIADGEYSDEAETTAVEVRLGCKIVPEPQTVNGLKAHFTPTFINPGYVYFANGKASVQSGNNVHAESNEAYLTYGANPIDASSEYDLAIQIDGKVADGIAPVLGKLAKATDAYTLDGRLVKKNATLSTLKTLTPGIYVLGGVKVMVK